MKLFTEKLFEASLYTSVIVLSSSSAFAFQSMNSQPINVEVNSDNADSNR
jgi:lipopolysaccharide export system protein LptA